MVISGRAPFRGLESKKLGPFCFYPMMNEGLKWLIIIIIINKLTLELSKKEKKKST